MCVRMLCQHGFVVLIILCASAAAAEPYAGDPLHYAPYHDDAEVADDFYEEGRAPAESYDDERFLQPPPKEVYKPTIKLSLIHI